ncbi:MAG: ATP-grasp domain-containing protein [Deltaproteobacteria bacterium]|nr:ATP-grasp domain-containing protein [Deltaproteobacteria bacterium]
MNGNVEPTGTGPSVAVVYNRVGKDDYEALRHVDPESLDFTPAYPIAVATEQEEYDAVAGALAAEGFSVRLVNLRDRLASLHALLRRDPPQAVLNLVESFRGDGGLESAVAGIYDLYGIPYTGATPFGLALCRRKSLTKQLLLANGVPTPRYRGIRGPHLPRHHGLHYPVIVKPGQGDASAGVGRDSVVHDLDGFTRAVQRVFETHGSPILIEEFIEGRELHVAILGNDPPQVLPTLEYDFSDVPGGHPTIISYDVKWNPLKEVYHRVHEVCPAQLPRRLEQRLHEIALQAWRVTGCRDYARLDMRLTPAGRPYVLEVNPNPDLTEGVSFMLAAEKAGLGFPATLRRIVECALQRGTPPPAAPESAPAHPPETTE